MRHPADSSRSELRARQILDRHLARREFPGVVLALREPTGRSFTITAGTADPTTGAPVDTSTPWIIGSTTKTFVAVVVLQLAQEGKVDLDVSWPEGSRSWEKPHSAGSILV